MEATDWAYAPTMAEQWDHMWPAFKLERLSQVETCMAPTKPGMSLLLNKLN